MVTNCFILQLHIFACIVLKFLTIYIIIKIILSIVYIYVQIASKNLSVNKNNILFLGSMEKNSKVYKSKEYFLLVVIKMSETKPNNNKQNQNNQNQINIQQLADVFAKSMATMIQQAQNGNNEWTLATEPFKKPIEEQKENKNIITVSKTAEKKQLLGFKTYTFIDGMFIDENDKAIDGIPFGSCALLSGLPNSGKSLLIEEVCLQLASKGVKVAFVTSEEVFRAETPRYDLESRLKERAKILKLEWEKIADNLFVLDAVSNAELREWSNFVSTLRFLIETRKIDFVAIDSLTLLEDTRGQIKYRLGELMKYFQLHGITSLMVNQRAIDEADSLALAGGLALSHIADIVIEMDYKRLSSWDSTIKLDTNAKQGEVVYFFRILKNRICKYDARYKKYIITPEGLVRLSETKPN